LPVLAGLRESGIVIQPFAKRWRFSARCLRFILPGLSLLGLGGYLLVWNIWAAYHFRAAQRALDLRDFGLARLHLRPCLEVWPMGVRTRFLAARAAWRSGLYDVAHEHLAVCQRLPWAPEALQRERDLIRLKRGDVTVEQSLWARVDANDPEKQLILEILIQQYVSSYRLTRALDALNLFLQCQHDDVQALLGRGWVWEQLFDFARAVADYRRAVEIDSGNDAARLRLAETLLVSGPASAALDHFARLRQSQPGTPAVMLGLARCWRQLGQCNEARQLLDELLTGLPSKRADEDAAILSERGRIALDEAKPAEAEGYLRRAVAVAPYDRQANYNLYQCLQQQGQTDEAGQYRLALKRIDADLKRIDLVLKEVLKAPYNPSLRSEAGVIFLRNGETQKGLRWLNMALEQDPWHRPAHEALANYYQRTGRPDLAARHLQLAQSGADPFSARLAADHEVAQ
jgi:tetratricopeptide (TPR) repeat protein